MKRRYLIWLIVAVIIIAIVVLAYILIGQKPGANNSKSTTKTTLNYEDRTLALQKLFAAQSGQPLEKINISIARENTQFIKGIVNIQDNYEGIFLAQRENETWKIIWDGKKKYTCADIKANSVPKEISNCQ